MPQQIDLTRGYVTTVDADNHAALSGKGWYAHTRRGKVYAVRHSDDDHTKMEHLHRIVAGAPPRMVVDHINGNTLDNRRENLRVCTHANNMRNRGGPATHNTTGFIGVKVRKSGRFTAYIRSQGTSYTAGTFDTAEEAARARDRLTIQLHGEFAALNFPLEKGGR